MDFFWERLFSEGLLQLTFGEGDFFWKAGGSIYGMFRLVMVSSMRFTITARGEIGHQHIRGLWQPLSAIYVISSHHPTHGFV